MESFGSVAASIAAAATLAVAKFVAAGFSGSAGLFGTMPSSLNRKVRGALGIENKKLQPAWMGSVNYAILRFAASLACRIISTKRVNR